MKRSSSIAGSKTSGKTSLIRSPTIPLNCPGPGYPVKSWGPLYPQDSNKPRTVIMQEMHDGKMAPINPRANNRVPKLPRGSF
jgi:hypothetical protein